MRDKEHEGARSQSILWGRLRWRSSLSSAAKELHPPDNLILDQALEGQLSSRIMNEESRLCMIEISASMCFNKTASIADQASSRVSVMAPW